MSPTLIWRTGRGPSTEPTLIPQLNQVAAMDFQWQKIGVKIQNILMFEELWQSLVSKVTGIGSPV